MITVRVDSTQLRANRALADADKVPPILVTRGATTDSVDRVDIADQYGTTLASLVYTPGDGSTPEVVLNVIGTMHTSLRQSTENSVSGSSGTKGCTNCP